MTENIALLTHSSIRIKDADLTIYIDPFKVEGDPKDGDLILITHDHFDHFSPEDIAKVAKADAVLVAPEKMAKKAQEAADIVGEIKTVSPGGSYQIEGLKFETVPAYNMLKPFHPKKAGWVGYILEVDAKRVYIAGDTDATKEAEAVECDIAMIPVGGTYTMDARKAAKLINAMKPAIAIPTHYGSVVGKPEDGETFAKLVEAPVEVELKI